MSPGSDAERISRRALLAMPDYLAYERGQTRRTAVGAAWLVLVALPLVQLIEYLTGHHGGAADPLLLHALWRLPAMAVALAVLVLDTHSPDGHWPRPIALLLGLAVMAAPWALTALHLSGPDEQVHEALQHLVIVTVAVSALSVRGARDLVPICLPALALGVAILLLRGPGLAQVAAWLVHPLLAIVLGGVIAELLFRGQTRAFIANRQIRESALTDSLTGLPNRRAMDDALRVAHARVRRHGGHYAVVMADLDRFKRVNDTWGHAVGDEVLCELGRRLRSELRANDMAGRWGGEEFLVLLQDVDADAAWHTAEKLRVRIGGETFATSAGELPVTVSLGVAMSRDEPRPENVVKRADDALYEAKRAGRNRVVAG
ncbi:MAG TPA: GGDEF domain-containing protein [Arenimonas sp.]|nr:GGDEF domain-containing protein [Arenimonas sp.]